MLKPEINVLKQFHFLFNFSPNCQNLILSFCLRQKSSDFNSSKVIFLSKSESSIIINIQVLLLIESR